MGSRKFRTLLLSAVWGRGGGTAGVVSPNTFKRLHDFSHGVLDHVKSYYNSSLWQTDSKGTSVLSTPIVAGNPKQMQNGSAGMPNQLKEAETLKRPSSETETEMPEMSEVSPSLQNGNKQSKQLVSVGLSNKGLCGNPLLSFFERWLPAPSCCCPRDTCCSVLHGLWSLWSGRSLVHPPLNILTKDPACRVPFAHKSLNFVSYDTNTSLHIRPKKLCKESTTGLVSLGNSESAPAQTSDKDGDSRYIMPDFSSKSQSVKVLVGRTVSRPSAPN